MIECIWDDEDRTILRHIYRPGWVIADYHHLLDQSYQMAISVPHTIYMITDMSLSPVSPAQLLSTRAHIEKTIPPNLDLNVIVKAPHFVRIMIDIGTRVTRTPAAFTFVYADSLAEAYTLIAERRRLHERQTVWTSAVGRPGGE